MDFTNADRESNTWQKLKAHYEARLAFLRQQNDGRMEDGDRNFHIGQIKEVTTLLALDKANDGIQL